jgi:outer membrane beta-barrel protein
MLKISFLILGLFLLITSRNTQAGEKSLYDFLWLDPDKKVYVLQNKLFKKEHTFYADVGYLSNFTSKFQDTSGFTGRVGFYIHEEWGVELMMNKYNNANNDEYRNVLSVNNVEPFIRRLNSSYAALAIWSPFYGKINTFNRIFYFDWSFGAGPAKIDAESNLKTVGPANVKTTYKKESYTGAIVKTNVKVHITENVHLGLEYMNTYYTAPGPRNPKSDRLRTNTDVVLSVGFSF